MAENKEWICEKCAYFPPSSGDGKPCSFCWPEDPITNCFREKQDNDEE